MIKLKISLHCCCVLNSHKCSTPILSEIVHVTLKSAAVVTSEHLNLSAIFVINHSSLNAKVSLWMKVNPVFRNPEKVSLFFLKRGDPPINGGNKCKDHVNVFPGPEFVSPEWRCLKGEVLLYSRWCRAQYCRLWLLGLQFKVLWRVCR